jgi:hypothetical protein
LRPLLIPSRILGRIPKWTKGADCKSVIRRFESDSGLFHKKITTVGDLTFGIGGAGSAESEPTTGTPAKIPASGNVFDIGDGGLKK